MAPKRSFKHGRKLKYKLTYSIIVSNGEERIKYAWCVKFKGDTPYAREDSSTIKLSRSNGHVVCEAHKC